MLSFSTHSLLFSLLLISTSSGQQNFPQIPPSDRILTVTEVQNYWVHQLSNKPLPKKPTGLHPEKQAKWRNFVAQRNSFIASIQAGQFKTKATLAQLRHNSAAYTALKQDDEAAKTLAQLRDLEAHLEKMKTLRLQQDAAKKELADSKKLAALRNEISQLESEVSQLHSNSYSSDSDDSDTTPAKPQKPSPRPAKGSPAKKES